MSCSLCLSLLCIYLLCCFFFLSQSYTAFMSLWLCLALFVLSSQCHQLNSCMHAWPLTALQPGVPAFQLGACCLALAVTFCMNLDDWLSLWASNFPDVKGRALNQRSPFQLWLLLGPWLLRHSGPPTGLGQGRRTSLFSLGCDLHPPSSSFRCSGSGTAQQNESIIKFLGPSDSCRQVSHSQCFVLIAALGFINQTRRPLLEYCLPGHCSRSSCACRCHRQDYSLWIGARVDSILHLPPASTTARRFVWPQLLRCPSQGSRVPMGGKGGYMFRGKPRVPSTLGNFKSVIPSWNLGGKRSRL